MILTPDDGLLGELVRPSEMGPGEMAKLYAEVEKHDAKQWKRCYPRNYQEYKPHEYFTPKMVARQMHTTSAKIELGYIGEAEKYEVFWASRMAQLGVPQYWVERDLMTAMEHTTPPMVLDWYHMGFPREAAAFMVPKGSLVHEKDGPASFIAYSRHKIGEEIPSLARAGPVTWRSHNGAMILFAKTERPDGDGYFSHWNFPQDKIPTIELKRVFDTLKQHESETHSSGFGYGDTQMDRSDTIFAAKVAHFVFSLLLFMMRKPELVEYGKLEKRVKPKRAGELPREFWTPHVIGRNYRLRRAPRHLGGTHASPRYHWVDGHWKDVHYGPGRSMVKEILIDPYERGFDE